MGISTSKKSEIFIGSASVIKTGTNSRQQSNVRSRRMAKSARKLWRSKCGGEGLGVDFCP